MIRTPRTFNSPKSIGVSLTLDEMELFEHSPTPLGEWSHRVLGVEREKTLDEIGADRFLPRLVATADLPEGTLAEGLVNRSGQIFTAYGWVWPEDPIDMDGTEAIEEADVAFVARAIIEGADAVLFRTLRPSAIIADVGADKESEGEKTLPKGAVVTAIVDSADRNSVLELVAVAPGPEVFRRNDGAWHRDSEWVQVLKSLRPPAMVKVDESVIPSVVKQVDTATAGQKFVPFKATERNQYITASAYLQELEQEALVSAVAMRLALAPVVGSVASTERLRRYWLYGKGAAKIRWGTPGAWTRCERQLRKHLGPMAPGYCTNLSQRLGGQGVATHVGSK